MSVITLIISSSISLVAIWGELIRDYIYPIKINITNALREGEATLLGNEPCYIFHLNVQNLNNSRIVEKCRVLLTGYSKNGKRTNFNAFRPFLWAPSEIEPQYIDITNSNVFDFGYIKKNEMRFELILLNVPKNYSGSVNSGENIIYHLRVDAKSLRINRNFDVLVKWTGQWEDNEEIMRNRKNLQISILKIY